jgi:hypothetical protein
MGFWDEDHAKTDGGKYTSFNKIGDTITGTVAELAVGEDYNSNPCPQLVLKNATGEWHNKAGVKTVANNEDVKFNLALTQLKSKGASLRPNVGQVVSATFVSETKVAKGTAKEFTFTVSDGPAASGPVADAGSLV